LRPMRKLMKHAITATARFIQRTERRSRLGADDDGKR
jgi:hypothetical protein